MPTSASLSRPRISGFRRQVEYFEREADRLGHAPPVIDSNAILADPDGMLAKLCAALGIAWDPAMLRWEAGPHATDGIWACALVRCGLEPAPALASPTRGATCSMPMRKSSPMPAGRTTTPDALCPVAA